MIALPLQLALAIGLAAARPSPEELVTVSLVDNGDFDEPLSTAPDLRSRLVPWWVTERGRATIVREGGRSWLVTAAGTRVSQPLALPAASVPSLRVSGRVRGAGRVTLTDGTGAEAVFEVEGAGALGAVWHIDGPALAARLGRPPIPRLRLALEARDGARAEWSAIEAGARLAAPSEAELAEEILGHVDEIFGWWLARGRDDVGPRRTGFFCHAWDAVTGERLKTFPGGAFPLAEFLLRALRWHEDAGWREAFERYVDDWLTLCFSPQTGLPRRWDCLGDRPLDDGWIEIAADLDLLLDLAESGPPAFRERARARADRIVETVLESGVLPDGSVAAKYRPRDAAVSSAVVELRRLDVPAQLAHHAALTGDPRGLVAARNALAQVEYLLHWSMRWETLEPGFDDDFGHYGRRAVTMLEWFPDERAFANLALSGYEHLRSPWRDAMRFGGSLAADDPRAWSALIDLAELRPQILPELRPLLEAAVRCQWKSQQYGDGSWGDVTYYRFDPKLSLEVGDLPGTPSNLLWGLALCYDESLGLRTAAMRARYAAVLRTSVRAYRRPYGYLVTQREHEGANRVGGEIRLLLGLVEMLERL